MPTRRPIRSHLVQELRGVGLLQPDDAPGASWTELAGESPYLLVEVYLDVDGSTLTAVELEATADADHREDGLAVAQYAGLLTRLVHLADR